MNPTLVDSLHSTHTVNQFIYFVASWCPPCQGFTPILVQFYNKCVKEGKIEIVYISSDRTVESFEGYYGKMPWLALPSDPGTAGIKNKLAQLFEITGIPTSIVLQVPSGQFVTDGVRDPVVRAADNKEQALKLVDSWKSMPSVPLEDAAQGGYAKAESIGDIVLLYFQEPCVYFRLAVFFQVRQKAIGKFVGKRRCSGRRIVALMGH